MTTTTTRDRLQAQIDSLEAEIARLENLPDEPTTPEPLIWFQKTLRGTTYTYAAIKAPDGLWYVTGYGSPQGMAWDALLDFAVRGQSALPQIWLVNEYGLLA